MESKPENAHKKNDARPSEASLQRLSEDRRFFKAVANYMANVLGIDRNTITEMLAKKVESRNVDQLVSEAVCRYFGFGPNANGGIGYAVDSRLDKTVDQYVRETMDKTCRGWIDRAVQIKCEEIAGVNSSKDVAFEPGAEKVPSLYRYSAAAYVELPLLQKIAGDWIRNNLPMPARVNFTVKLNPSKEEAACIDFHGLKDEEADMLNPLRAEPGHYRAPYGACRIRQYGVEKLVAELLCWDRIGRMIADENGLAVFPPEA